MNSGTPMEVYFDDLTINHKRSPVVAGSDFYPFGMPMENRSITRESYRYGYQGQYSAMDSVTKWNAFELRMYDPSIGRWLSPDPYGIGDSPYIGMANNPVSLSDPDGGCPWCDLLDFLNSDEVFGVTHWNTPITLNEVVVTATQMPSNTESLFASELRQLNGFKNAAISGITSSLTDLNKSLNNTAYFANAVNHTLTGGAIELQMPQNNIQQQMQTAGLVAGGLGLRGMGPGSMTIPRSVAVTPSGPIAITQPIVVPVTTVLDVHGTVSAKSPVNRVNSAIRKGQAPKTIERADTGKILGEKDHVHFTDDNALNIDGTWKHGGRILTNAEKTFLSAHGWRLP